MGYHDARACPAGCGKLLLDPLEACTGCLTNVYANPVDTKHEELELARMRGPGGAPTRATTLPEDPAERKKFPVASGVLDYFPDALVAVSAVSKAGNDQHNPGLPLRWTRGKSGDEADTLMRHFLQRGTRDTDGHRHSAKVVWRALAMLQKEIEAEQDATK